jgi:radical SAM superfamily enzyme YgiQ (UPF0313 family)
MDILLVSANRERSPYPVFPIGLAFLAGPLAAAGHRLRGLDLCFTPDPEKAMDEALAEFRPGAVVVSIRNLDNVTWPGSRSYLRGVMAVVERCRGIVPVIVGGSGFSLMPAELLAHLDADYGVVGEGEEVLPLLIDAIAHDGPLPELPGVLARGTDRWLPPRPVAAVGTPDRTLFDVARYHREGGMANVQTKRGCPFACIYCTYPLLEGCRVRPRPVAEIVAEIRGLAEEHGVDYIYFVDDIFNYPTDFATALCRAMNDARLAVNWSAFINPGFITPELMGAMVEAGCDAVEFGTDSGSPAMLKSLGKSFSVDDVRNSSRICRETGVDFAHYILFGGPGETAATVMESFALLDEVAPTAVIAMTGIRIFPGTPLHRQALREGLITPDTPLVEPVFYIAPGIKDELCALVSREALSRRNWAAPGLEINMSDAMLEAMRLFPVRGPLWKLMKRLGRSRVRPLGT